MNHSPKEEKKISTCGTSDLSNVSFTKPENSKDLESQSPTAVSTTAPSLESLTMPAKSNRPPFENVTTNAFHAEQPKTILDKLVDWLAQLLTQLDNYLFKNVLKSKKRTLEKEEPE